jgi:prepilin peptidase CpaA
VAKTFFPDPAFAWVFCLGLCLLTCVAAYLDTRTTKIPNRLSVLVFALGLVVNIVRGAWLASQNKPLWVFDSGNVLVGAIDGLLFSLVGFAVMFAAMFVFWILGMCGGGDVKLFAAIAAWVGLTFVLLGIWLLSVVALFFWFGASILGQGLSPRQVNRTLDALKTPTKATDDKDGAPKKRPKLRLTYSLPIAVATVITLAFAFRVELQLVQPPPQPLPQEGTTADARPEPEVA